MCSYYALNLVRTQLFSILILISLHSHLVQGGNCWSLIGKNGRCQGLLKAYISKEDCCEEGSATVAWSSDDLSSGKLFFWRALGGGAPNCQPCRETCDSIDCGQGKKCVVKKQKPRCVCAPDCSKHKHTGAVCATDGKTYRNYCSLLKHRCRQKKYIEVGYYGKCQASCTSVTCPDGKHCVVDQNKQPHCVQCTQQCRDSSGPEDYVCGVDGVTYESFCELRKAACQLGRAIPLAYAWKCEGSLTCNNLRCGEEKVCLVDRDSGRPRCTTCNLACRLSIVTTVCGTDNITYSSWCELRAASCRSGYVIETKHSGPCGAIPTTEPEYLDPSELETEEEEAMDDEEDLTFNHIIAPPSDRFRTS